MDLNPNGVTNVTTIKPSDFPNQLTWIPLVLVLLLFCTACDRETGEGRLALAISKGETSTVEKLIDSGVDVNQQNQVTKETALMTAVRSEEIDVVAILLRAGANPNLQDVSGMTALMWAVEGGDKNTNLVRILLDAGARPSISDKSGVTAIDIAKALPTRPEILKLLEGK
jgi:ankyrin repeat protein